MSDAGKGGAAASVVDKGGAGAGGATGADAGKAASDAGKSGAAAGADAGKGAASVVDAALAADAGAGDAGKGAAQHSWPDDWRDQIAGGDAKLGGLLKRYSDPGAVAKALGALRTRLDSGEFKKGLAADANEAEIAEYRKENGIPDKAEGYELPKGVKVEELDQPIIDAYRANALKNNLTPAEVQRNIEFFYQAREQMAAQTFEADAQRKAENEDALRTQWGPEFRSNIAGLKSFIVGQTNEEFFGNLMTARLGNGNIVGNDAQALQFLVSAMKEINPTATLIPGGDSSAKGLSDRIGELEAMQRDPAKRQEYYRDDKYSNELLQLYAQRDKVAARGKAA